MAKANTTNYGLADNLDFSKPKRNNTNVINNTNNINNINNTNAKKPGRPKERGTVKRYGLYIDEELSDYIKWKAGQLQKPITMYFNDLVRYEMEHDEEWNKRK